MNVHAGSLRACPCEVQYVKPVSPRRAVPGPAAVREALGAAMQLPDESVEFNYQGLLNAPPESWTPLAELQAQQLLPPERVDALKPLVMNVRTQVAAERDLPNAPAKLRPLDSGFIDLPQKLLDQQRRKGDASELGRILSQAN